MYEKKISSTLIFEGRIMKLYKDNVELENGVKSTREVVVKPKAVCILPIIDNKIVLIKQFRYPLNKEVYELPAGMVECGEDIVTAAKRELEEEIGYICNDLKPLGSIYTSCGFTDEKIYLYYACNLVKSQVNFDYDESIVSELHSFESVEKMIKDGIIDDAKTICAINNYFLFTKK